MVICESFVDGYCELGPNCLNEHIDLFKLVRQEVDSAIMGKQWPISCFGPFSYQPNFPNFIEDQSFEEIRFQFYEAKVGNWKKIGVKFKNLFDESRSKLNQLNKPSHKRLNIFVQLYNTEPKSINSAIPDTDNHQENLKTALENLTLETNKADLDQLSDQQSLINILVAENVNLKQALETTQEDNIRLSESISLLKNEVEHLKQLVNNNNINTAGIYLK